VNVGPRISAPPLQKGFPTMKKTIARISVIAALAAALAVTGCNTVKGVGKDIETAGDKTQKAINE
jgi:predicted small secreted protein